MLTVRRLLAVGVVATTAAYVGLVVPNAAANGTFAFPGATSLQGRLELTSTSNSLTVTWYGTNGLPRDSESVTLGKNDKCLIDDVAVGELGRLLKIRPTAGGGTRPLGYVSNGLGTRDNNTCNTANGTLGAGEAMELSVGSDFLGQGIAFDYARLDVEGKFGTTLSFTTLQTPGGTPTPGAPVNPGWTGSDNGSDSGSSDNRDVEIGTAAADDNFVTLSIFPTGDPRGQISLEAGGDYGNDPTTHYTTLWLVQQTDGYEYALECGQTRREVAAPGTDFGVTPAGLATLEAHPIEATVARYANGLSADGNAIPCTAIGANIGSSDLNVLLRKTTTNATNVFQNPKIRFEIVWVVPMSEIGSTPDPFQRFIDLDGIDGTNLPGDPFPKVPAQPCTSYTPSETGLDPTLGGVDGFLSVVNPGVAIHPANTPWCVIGEVRTPSNLNGVPVMIQRMFWDGQGDPKFF